MKELIVNLQNEFEDIYLIEDGVLTERYHDVKNKRKLEGNIYIARVQNIIPGLQAAFVDVGENKNAFIHLKDVLPKVDVVNSDEKVSVVSDISNVVTPGSPIVVEIKRDSYNKKGARASTHINIPGRYCVFLPNSPFVTASQKIEDEDERKRLIEITSKYVPEGMGAIVRTSAIGKSDDEIKRDMESLIAKWHDIISVEFFDDYPKLLYKANELIDKLLMDLIDKDLNIIHVNSDEVKKIMEEKIAVYNKDDIEVVVDYDDAVMNFKIQSQLEICENRKVWLKSGGFITIDKTEALTAIDVNSGKYVGKKSLEDTAFAINKEAAVEIAKQLRLRDIGGIVVIDFIDMHVKKNQEDLVEVFAQEIKNERTKVQIEGFTKLNLLELTRKHLYSE